MLTQQDPPDNAHIQQTFSFSIVNEAPHAGTGPAPSNGHGGKSAFGGWGIYSCPGIFTTDFSL
jgi:hypothetical protein